MATFVIVHGAFGGGWEWTPVARMLRASGHDVFTPTLTGMGDRAHVGRGQAIGLTTHVDDLTALLEVEDLDDVVLCGASYGGVPVTGAADRVSDRIALVMYVDALVPHDGQSALDLLPDRFGDLVRSGIRTHGADWRMPIPPNLLEALLPQGSISDEERARFVARLCDHPAAAFTEPIRLRGAVGRLPRAFLRCTSGDYEDALGGDPIAECAASARAQGWPYREIALGHDPHLFDPSATAAVLNEFAMSQMAAARDRGARPTES